MALLARYCMAHWRETFYFPLTRFLKEKKGTFPNSISYVVNIIKFYCCHSAIGRDVKKDCLCLL